MRVCKATYSRKHPNSWPALAFATLLQGLVLASAFGLILTHAGFLLLAHTHTHTHTHTPTHPHTHIYTYTTRSFMFGTGAELRRQQAGRLAGGVPASELACPPHPEHLQQPHT